MEPDTPTHIRQNFQKKLKKKKLQKKKKEAKKKKMLGKGKYTPDKIRGIIDSANIVKVVGAFVDLKKVGTNFTGLCPFHNDHHTGNLIVSPTKNIVTCFACGDGAMDSVAFLQKSGLGFIEAIEFIAKQEGIATDGDFDMSKLPLKKEPQKGEPLYMNIKLAKLRTDNYEMNPLANWIYHLPWPRTIYKASVNFWLKEYMVGVSIAEDTKGWTIWWQIDEEGRLLTGKLMKYKDNGRRDRDARYSIDYIHSMLQRVGKLNLEGKSIQSCLFGLHLVPRYNYQTVCIVESEKSALIAQIMNDDNNRVFTATGGKGRLNKNMLQPLMDRNCGIVLYPDVDAIDEWRKFAREFDYNKISVTKNIKRLYDKDKDSDHADIADILIRRMEEQRDRVFIKND